MMEEFERLQSVRRNCLANHVNWLDNLKIRKLDRYRYVMMYGTSSTHFPSDFAVSPYFLEKFPNGRSIIIKLIFCLQIHAFST